MPIIVPFFSETVGWTATIDGRVYRPALIDSSGHLQVDVLSSALPSGAATAARQDTMITALQLIDDLRNALAAVATDQLRADIIAALPAGTANIGDVDLASFGWTPVTKTGNYAAAQTDAVVWTPASGKAIVLLGVLLSTDTAMNIQIESSNVDVIPPCYFAANGGAVISGGGPLWKGTANATLDITSSAAGNHSALLWGYEV